MKEITVVTAFFDINRSDWGKYTRTPENYLNYFSKWAKLKNKLVVYVENQEIGNKVLKIREKYNLKDKTIINIVDDYRKIDPELYSSIKKTNKNVLQQSFRVLPKNPESWNYNYNYVMLLKMWCVKDSIEKNQAEGMVAWIDFGFNHGGGKIEPNDFDFEWKYDFEEKINLFSIQDLDNRPIFEIVRSMDVYLMGTVLVSVDFLWDKFWKLMKESMISLNSVGLVDDDQTILLMAYRKEPEIFKINKSGWMTQIKDYGGSHQRIISNNSSNSLKNKLKKTFLKRIYSEIRDIKLNFEYCTKTFRTLSQIKRK